MRDEVRARNLIEDHFANPRNVGEMVDAGGTGTAGSITDCGDMVKIFIKVDRDKLARVTFKTIGCPAAIASGSMTTELATDKTLDEAAMIASETVDAALGGLPKTKRRCSNLGAEALQAAIEDLISQKDFEAVRPENDRRVAVAMSGGVDSSTAAAILKKDGYDVIGITMRLHDTVAGEAVKRTCCSPLDIGDARSVAGRIGFPHFSVDFREVFRREVIDTFCADYLSGRTPNPCMECNRQIKFKNLIEKASKLGAGKVATGHYVNIIWNEKLGRYLIKRAYDRKKDQSYMFWAASQKVLAKLLTPLGGSKKAETRRLAAEFGLPVALKAESQEICFIPDNDYRRFLEDHNGYRPEPGPIVDLSGRRLGTHRGLPFYTVGQRRGLGIAHPEPLYVLAINTEKNMLVVGAMSEFYTKTLTATRTNFILFDDLKNPMEAAVMYRYNMQPVPAKISPLGAGRIKVDFADAQGGIAPGQSVVLYDGDLVVGGGIINGP